MKKFTTIDEYIAAQDPAIQPQLQKVRATILAAAPNATEKMSWQMPTFWQGQNLIHFAIFKHHLGLYPGSEAIVAFAAQLKKYKTSKGTIQLPLDQPLDYQLITAITKWRVKVASDVNML